VEPVCEGRRVAALEDKGDIIGAVVVTKQGMKPVYVSVGHRVSLKRATEIIMECKGNYRIPEPIRRAYLIANQEKRRLQSNL
jgi:deoxyribonuclease V